MFSDEPDSVSPDEAVMNMIIYEDEQMFESTWRKGNTKPELKI